MRIVETYSHLNGLEFLMVHRPGLWTEIKEVIQGINAANFRTKVSKEKTMMGKLLFAPIEMNAAANTAFARHGWKESRTSYWVTKDAKLIRKTMNLSAAEQRAEIEAAGEEAIFSYNQTDFVKDRV